MSIQLVFNKYNTNYAALRLADSTALTFKSWQNFIKANYYKLMNYHKPSYIVINQKSNHVTTENHTKPSHPGKPASSKEDNPTNQKEDLGRS